MGMPRGLAKATNYYNRLQAWEDWDKIKTQAICNGYNDLVAKYTPPTNAGWRKIDKCIAALRKEMEQRKADEEQDHPHTASMMLNGKCLICGESIAPHPAEDPKEGEE